MTELIYATIGMIEVTEKQYNRILDNDAKTAIAEHFKDDNVKTDNEMAKSIGLKLNTALYKLSNQNSELKVSALLMSADDTLEFGWLNFMQNAVSFLSVNNAINCLIET